MNQTYQFEPQGPQRGGKSNALTIVLVILAAVFFLMLIGCGILVALLLPAVSAARTAAQRQMESNNLKQIGFGILNYEATYRAIPAVHGVNTAGEATGSWRVTILPFLDNNSAVYDRFDSRQAWDSPTNQLLADSMPVLYRSPRADPAQPANHTNIFTIQDPNSAMPSGGTYLRFSRITDGLSNTIVAISLPEHSAPWLQPTDLTIAEALQHIRAAKHPQDIQLLMLDGAVIPLGNLSDQEFTNMATIDDGTIVAF